MIDLEVEDLVPLKEMPKLLPKRAGKAVSISTLWRWANTGARGQVLDTVLIGGQRYSSPQAFRRFVAAGNRGKVARPDAARQADEAAVRLDALGW